MEVPLEGSVEDFTNVKVTNGMGSRLQDHLGVSPCKLFPSVRMLSLGSGSRAEYPGVCGRRYVISRTAKASGSMTAYSTPSSSSSESGISPAATVISSGESSCACKLLHFMYVYGFMSLAAATGTYPSRNSATAGWGAGEAIEA